MFEKLTEILQTEWYAISIHKTDDGVLMASVDFGEYGIHDYKYNPETQNWEIVPK